MRLQRILVDQTGIEPANLLGANEALSQLSYWPQFLLLYMKILSWSTRNLVQVNHFSIMTGILFHGLDHLIDLLMIKRPCSNIKAMTTRPKIHFSIANLWVKILNPAIMHISIIWCSEHRYHTITYDQIGRKLLGLWASNPMHLILGPASQAAKQSTLPTLFAPSTPTQPPSGWAFIPLCNFHWTFNKWCPRRDSNPHPFGADFESAA